ncbi:hypothetical protein ACHWQZ_G016546 [Mnemiopsis leidyi]
MFHVVLASIPICILGTIFNSLCFSFFIRRRNKRLGDQLLLLLNILDISVCISGTITASLYFYLIAHRHSTHLDRSYWVFTVVFSTGLSGTAFATCLLSFTRTIAMCFPFYKINRRYILFSILLFLLLQTVRQIVFAVNDKSEQGKIIQKYVGIIGIILLLLIIVSVLVSNTVSIVKLRANTYQWKVKKIDTSKSRLRSNRRHATVTVITLSVVFCILNSLYISGYMVNLHLGKGEELPFYHYTVWLFIPLNSVLNPVVYFARKRGVRSFMSRQLRSLSRAVI